jgi:hypothetical protein
MGSACTIIGDPRRGIQRSCDPRQRVFTGFSVSCTKPVVLRTTAEFPGANGAVRHRVRVLTVIYSTTIARASN